MEEYRYIAERLCAYDNVEVYFFPDREDIILDLNHYADYSHYHPDYNRFMAECFADGTGRVYTEKFAEESAEGSEGRMTIDDYLAHMRQIVENFDFEGLLVGG